MTCIGTWCRSPRCPTAERSPRASSTLLVADLTANTPLKPQAWTFASPRVGDAIFAARYGGLSTVSWRIYNQVDVVPYFPVASPRRAISSLCEVRCGVGSAPSLIDVVYWL